jgi:hypothetical protein
MHLKAKLFMFFMNFFLKFPLQNKVSSLLEKYKVLFFMFY